MGVFETVNQESEEWVVPDDDDIGGDDIDLSTTVSEEEAREQVEEAVKQKRNRTHEEVAQQVKEKGIVQTSSKHDLNKEDDALPYYIKKMNELERVVQMLTAKLDAKNRADAIKQEEWKKMKMVSFEMNTIIKNIQQGLNASDLSTQDINEIVNRVEKKLLKKGQSIKEPTQQQSTKQKLVHGKKALIFIAIVVMFGVVANYFYSTATADTTTAKIENTKGIEITKTVKANSVVLCRPQGGGEYEKYKIANSIAKVKGVLNSDNIFYFNYKNLLCKATNKDLS